MDPKDLVVMLVQLEPLENQGHKERRDQEETLDILEIM